MYLLMGIWNTRETYQHMLTTWYPYLLLHARDSKLTHLLQDSLGGNSYTILLATLPPTADALEESMATLRFASRVHNISNNPRINRWDRGATPRGPILLLSLHEPQQCALLPSPLLWRVP